MTRAPTIPAALCALLLAGCHSHDHSGPAHLAKARELLAATKDEEAARELAAAVKADPRSKEAYELTAALDKKTGDLQGAFMAYLRADMVDPGDHRAGVNAIGILIEVGERDIALARLNAMLGDDPKNTEAQALRALLEQQGGDEVKARRDVQNILVGNPNHPVARAVLAAQALADGDAAKAAVEIDRGLAVDPNNRWLLQVQVEAFIKAGAGDRALAVQRRLVDLDPGSAKFRIALADLEAKAGSIAAGEAVLRAGVTAAPRSGQMRLALAEYLSRNGKGPDAEAVLRDGIATDAGRSVFDLALASALAKRGDAAAAMTTLQTAVARLPDGAERTSARIGLARLTIGEGDLQAGRKMLDEVIGADPKNVVALMLRADLVGPEDNSQAMTDLLAVTGLHPTDASAFARLAAAYVRAGKPDEALAAAHRVADLNPSDLAATGSLVEVALALDRPAEGRAALDAFVTRNPKTVDGRVALAGFAIRRKDWATAASALYGLRGQRGAEDRAFMLEGAVDEARGNAASAADIYRGLLDKAANVPDRITAARAFARAMLAANRGEGALATVGALKNRLPPADAAGLGVILAGLQSGLGHADAAQAAFDAAIKATPTDASVYLGKAATLADADRIAPALAALSAGEAAGAPREPLRLAAASLQLKAGRTNEAIALYRAVLTDMPGSMVAANNLTSLLADAQPLDKAVLRNARDTLRRQSASTDPKILDTIAWADYRLGDVAGAAMLLKRAQAAQSSSPDIRFHYGAVLIASGDKAAGQALLRTVLDKQFTGQSEAAALLAD